MSCLTKEKMQCYIDAELSVEEANVVQAHLSNCETCSNNLAKLKVERQKLIEWMNFSVEDRMDIPVFVPPVEKRNLKKSSIRIILYAAVAAAMLLFVLHIFDFKQETKVPLLSNQNCVPEKMEESLMMEIDFANGVDANKPVHQQQMDITVIDANGRIVDSI